MPYNLLFKLNFNPQNFVSYLKYMGQGMLGILIVIGIVIVITALLNYFMSKSKKK